MSAKTTRESCQCRNPFALSGLILSRFQTEVRSDLVDEAFLLVDGRPECEDRRDAKARLIETLVERTFRGVSGDLGSLGRAIVVGPTGDDTQRKVGL